MTTAARSFSDTTIYQVIGPASGRVIKFFEPKGFGFIEGKGITEDIIVHFSELGSETRWRSGRKRLFEGQHVYFTLVKTNKGYRATKVKVVQEAH